MAAFARFWLLTILLGGVFLFGTAREWAHLILRDGLTINTNLFGTTYYSLVGLNTLHVTMGAFSPMATVALFYLTGATPAKTRTDGWRILSVVLRHFVDAVVWVVVLLGGFCRSELGWRSDEQSRIKSKCTAPADEADWPGVWIDAAVRRVCHGSLRQHSGRDTGRSRCRGLVPRGSSRGIPGVGNQ